jgi:hypothetical protein
MSKVDFMLSKLFFLYIFIMFLAPMLAVTASIIIFFINRQRKSPKLNKIAKLLLLVPIIVSIPGFFSDGIFTGGFINILFYVLPASFLISGIFGLVYFLAKKNYKAIWMPVVLFLISITIWIGFGLMLSGM